MNANPAGGLQHVAFWVDDIPEKLAELSERGGDFRIRQRFGDMHAYLDSASEPGVMIQLMARHELMVRLFDLIRAGADSWDGTTDPVRRIDWSTGTPRV